MSAQIKEFYTSPWVLPNEMIMGWLKWSADMPVQSITIDCDPNILFEQVQGYSGDFQPVKGQIAIDIRNIEIPGYVGFVGKYTALPDTEVNVIFNVLLKSTESTFTSSSTTQIVRPLLHVVGFSSVKIDNAKMNPDLNLKLVNSSEAEALNVDVKVEIESQPPGAIEIVIEKPTSIFERAPIRLLSVSSFLSKIKVKRPGKAKATLIFTYKDRADNEYKATLNQVELEITAENIAEVPIRNVIQGDADEVELQEVAPIVTR